jgi:mRNA interferase MazF
MKPGDIALVKFPFTHLAADKKRPVLILSVTSVSKTAQLFTVAMITSKLDGLKLDGDYEIGQWREASLLHPSLLRLSKIATVESDLIDKRIGALTDSDQREVKRILRRLLAYWL